MSPKKVELYEIIANRLQDGNASSEPSLDGAYEIPLPMRAGRRSEREVVFSLDAAFVIFVVFLILLGTAYLLGLQKGEQKAKESFSAIGTAAVPEIKAETLQLVGDSSMVSVADITIPKERYTLRLTEADDKSVVQKMKKDLLANAIIRDNKVGVFIFALTSPQGSTRYFLTLGSFGSQNDETLKQFQRYFKEQDNEKYQYAFAERVEDLGQVVE